MSSMRNAICMTAALSLGISSAFTQGKQPPPRQPTPEEDIRAIRQMMEEQALKIEAINQEVAKISQRLNDLQQAPAAPVAKAAEQPSSPAPLEGSAIAQPATPAPQAGQPAQGTQGTQGAQGAQAQATPLTSGSNPVHIVTKGETLTSIARRAKVTVAELLKLNKIENDRALQIGQALIMPTPKPQDSPTENPPK